MKGVFNPVCFVKINETYNSNVICKFKQMIISGDDMNQQSKTPLFDKLVAHKNKNSISFHVPGHKNGHVIPEAARSINHDMLGLDVTELTDLDDLHSPEGVILESEQLLAELYRVKKSFFLVNGTTVGNLAMIMAAIKEDDIVLVQRNCHKSILHALQLTHAKPVFINPEYDDDWHVATGLSVEAVKTAITEYPEAKALIVTYPNYYGMVFQLDKIIEIAHEKNIPVLVDEAHGAHFIAGEPFPASALTLGADVVVQSAHKTLPAMTMGSYLHFNSSIISLKRVETYLHMLQSSSPSYPIMASLDLARSYLGTFNQRDLKQLQSQIEKFRIELSEIPGLKVLPYKNDIGDLLKISIQSTRGWSGFELQLHMEELGIFAEMADPYNLLLVVPLLKAEGNYPFNEVIERIKTLNMPIGFVQEDFQYSIPIQKRDTSLLELSFREMEKLSRTRCSIQESIGKISAEKIVPYPPGVPLLYPGEKITEEDIKYINWLLEKGTRFQGGESLKEGYLFTF